MGSMTAPQSANQGAKTMVADTLFVSVREVETGSIGLRGDRERARRAAERLSALAR